MKLLGPLPRPRSMKLSGPQQMVIMNAFGSLALGMPLGAVLRGDIGPLTPLSLAVTLLGAVYFWFQSWRMAPSLEVLDWMVRLMGAGAEVFLYQRRQQESCRIDLGPTGHCPYCRHSVAAHNDWRYVGDARTGDERLVRFCSHCECHAIGVAATSSLGLGVMVTMADCHYSESKPPTPKES